MVPPHNGTQLSNKKEHTADTYTSRDESQKHNVTSKKPNTKGYILYDSTDVTFWKSKTVSTEIRCVVARGWG